MRQFIVPAIVFLSIGFTACATNAGTDVTATASSSSSSSSDAGLVTHNVSYVGTIDVLDVTTYQQGTHTLLLEGDALLLLESTDANLNLSSYIGKRVEVRGSLQPTVEAGGMLLRAQEVIVLDIASSSLSSASSTESTGGNNTMCGGIAGIPCETGQTCIDDPADGCDPAAGGADCSGICVTGSSSSSSVSSSVSVSSSSSMRSSTAPISSSRSSVSSSLPTASASSAAPVTMSSDMEQHIALLAKQTYTQDTLWTQKYCTSHIAFCVPVHKNWYFKSFGATTSNRWHVELGMKDIAELGDGAIILNLVSGTSASMQARDGQLKAQGSDVIGFRDWEDGTHFEIIADARLREAVQYMLSHITPYAVAQ